MNRIVRTFAMLICISGNVVLAQKTEPAPQIHEVFDAPLVSIADLNRRKVKSARPVRVKGVLITVMESSKLIVQDDSDTTAILVADPVPGEAVPMPQLNPGDIIEAVGSVVNQPTYAMKIYGMISSYVRVVGKGKVPEPEKVTFDTLLAYRNEGHWVTLEAVVHGWMLQPNRSARF